MQTAPSSEELKGIISTEAVQEAAHNLTNMHLFHIDRKTLTIGPGTPIQTSITILPNDLLEYEHGTGFIHLDPLPSTDNNIFARTWECIARLADHYIRHRATTFLNASTTHTSQKDLRDYPDANNAVWPAALQATKTILGYQGPTESTKAAHKALHSFLTKTKVSKVLSIAGHRANLDDFNMITAHLPLMQRAHRTNANATVYWFSTKANQAPDAPIDIIQQAYKTFTAHCLDFGFGNPDNLWKIFTGLHQPTVARHSPSRLTDIYPVICQSIAHAGVKPPNATLRYLLNQESLHRVTNKLLSAFITKSYLLSKDGAPAKEQADLRDQFQHFATETYYSPRTSQSTDDPIRPSLHEVIADHIPHNAPDWDTIKQIAQVTSTRTRPALPALTESAPDKIKTHRTPKTTELITILRSPQLRFTRDLLRRSVYFHTTPGNNLTLQLTGTQHRYLHIRRRANGTINAISLNYWAPYNGQPIPTTKNWNTTNWTTRGLLLEHATNLVLEHLTNQWENLRPAPGVKRPSFRQTGKATRDLLEYPPEDEPPLPNDADISESMKQAICSFTENLTVSVSQTLGHNPSIAHYNAATTLNDHIPELHQRNPGALAWAFNTPLPDHPLLHPSQLISAVKHSMKEAGVQPENWRFATTLPSPTIKSCLSSGNTHHAALMLNAAAKAHTQPDQTNTWHAINTIIPKLTAYLDDYPHPEITKENILTTLSLFTKATAHADQPLPPPTDQDPPHIQAIDLVDYVRHMSMTSHRIRSTTWNGLIQASDRWHRDTNLNNYNEMWQYRLKTTSGYYAAWTSPLPHIQAGEYHIIPILDELGLLEESRAMQHCVYTYAQLCITGNTRIFSVRTNTEKPQRVATTQLDLTPSGAWQEIQTKAPHNHLPPQLSCPSHQPRRRAVHRLLLQHAQQPAKHNHLYPPPHR